MIRSKAIKDTDPQSIANRVAERKKRPIYNWWYNSPLSDYWHKFTLFFKRPYRRAKKLYEWHKNVFSNDFDFDAHSIYAILEYKLKRIYPVLETGHAYQEDKDMQALRIAIKLAGRLKEDNYDMAEWDRHAKKWGELKTWFTPIEGSTNSMWNSSRPNVKTPEDEEQERTEMRAGYERGAAAKLRDQRNLFAILTKYMAVWWD
jgi:hypothetical protein